MAFDWWKSKKTVPESRAEGRRPNRVDVTGGLPSNEEMLFALYHGTFSGMEKASPLARIPIVIPMSLIGVPTPTSDDPATQEALDRITAQMTRKIKIINRNFLLAGTSWCYPKYERAAGLVWKVIKDSSVQDILLSLADETPFAVLVDEELQLTVGENEINNIRRKSRYDRQRVTVSYYGARVAGLDYTARNVAGVLPIKFALEPDDSVSRGHSVLEPILCDLKDYADIDKRVSSTLAKFTPKQIQKISNGKLAEWRFNNGLADDADFEEFDPALAEFVVNVDGEETRFEFLAEGATAGAEKTLERIFWKLFQGSGVPEMFWGGIASGNFASSDNQMQIMINKINDYRDELAEPYRELFAASLRLLSVAELQNYDQNITIAWNKLDSVSEKDKATIFKDFASGIGTLLTSGGVGVAQLYELWKSTYPDLHVGTIEEFKAELVKAANLQQFIKQDYAAGEEAISAAGSYESVIDKVVK